ncbi:MAG TPA: DUF2157 domain-containing protein [Allosphingosinicella sp.]|nr:DUF2157 domain-containing protein [Allosphingosinicella sp.]
MDGLRGEVLDWFEAGRIAPGRERAVLRAASILPAPADWRDFLGRLTLWLGTVALAVSIIFFFAFNWDELGRFAKLGLVEAAILIVLLACWRLDPDSAPGKAALLALSLLAGALLALTGQIYQTGADTFELFGWWALLILPWVVVSRFSPLWLLWLFLLDLAAFFYFQRSWQPDGLLWSLFGLNAVALAGWEAAHRLGVAWLRDSWPPRLVAMVSGAAATALAIWGILDSGRTTALAGLAYLAWLAAFYLWYRRARPDLFMLAVGLLSLIIAVAVFLADNVLGSGSAGLLLIGLVVIGMSAGGAVWLRSAAREAAA